MVSAGGANASLGAGFTSGFFIGGSGNWADGAGNCGDGSGFCPGAPGFASAGGGGFCGVVCEFCPGAFCDEAGPCGGPAPHPPSTAPTTVTVAARRNLRRPLIGKPRFRPKPKAPSPIPTHRLQKNPARYTMNPSLRTAKHSL